MMMNLFSVFDPSSLHMSFPWLLLPAMSLMMPKKMWKVTAPHENMKKSNTSMLLKEISFSSNSKKSQETILISAFIIIASMNFSALYPQVYSLSSHLLTTLPLSLTLWVTINLFGWTKNYNHMLAHLVPQGTPSALMMFMVMIEMTSNIIRPITLCVRLTANMIAGHLLMALLGNAMMSISYTSSLAFLATPLILTILESAVAIIQSYVFMTLITLYMAETK